MGIISNERNVEINGLYIISMLLETHLPLNVVFQGTPPSHFAKKVRIEQKRS